MSNAEVMIVAGEASGDMHAARLVAAMRERQPSLNFCGIGGPELAAQGMESLFDAARLAVVGLLEVFGHLADIRSAMRILDERLRDRPPRLLILIDFPDFNLMIAKKAKRYGVPVFYYISPQVWAWRSGRVRKIARLVDRMAVILPFEQEFYHQRGMEVDFVGHPLLDAVAPSMDRASFLARHNIAPDARVVGILPGSRRKEVAFMLPTFLEAAKKLDADLPGLTFLCPLAPTLRLEDLQQHGLADCDLDIKVIAGNRYDLMAACEVVMAVSGTVTLELAMLQVPMVVAYRVSSLSHFIGNRFIKVQYASLVNLVADREVVPEFLQQRMTVENVHRAMHRLLTEPAVAEEMRRLLVEVCTMLGGAGASRRAAAIALDMLTR